MRLHKKACYILALTLVAGSFPPTSHIIGGAFTVETKAAIKSLEMLGDTEEVIEQTPITDNRLVLDRAHYTGNDKLYNFSEGVKKDDGTYDTTIKIMNVETNTEIKNKTINFNTPVRTLSVNNEGEISVIADEYLFILDDELEIQDKIKLTGDEVKLFYKTAVKNSYELGEIVYHHHKGDVLVFKTEKMIYTSNLKNPEKNNCFWLDSSSKIFQLSSCGNYLSSTRTDSSSIYCLVDLNKGEFLYTIGNGDRCNTTINDFTGKNYNYGGFIPITTLEQGNKIVVFGNVYVQKTPRVYAPYVLVYNKSTDSAVRYNLGADLNINSEKNTSFKIYNVLTNGDGEYYVTMNLSGSIPETSKYSEIGTGTYMFKLDSKFNILGYYPISPVQFENVNSIPDRAFEDYNGTLRKQIKLVASSTIKDITPPTISDTKVELSDDKKSSKITVTAKDDLSNNISYKLNEDGDWQTENSFVVNKNGEYIVYVKDEADNISSKLVTVEGIKDFTLPIITEVTQTLSEDKESVKLVINATDEVLEELEYSINGKDYQKLSEFVIKENGEYSVTVKDKSGNISKESLVVVNTIVSKDLEAPKVASVDVTYTSDKQTALLTVNATDNVCKELEYSIDGITYQESNQFNITENGTYTVLVKDKSNNISVGYKVIVNDIVKLEPVTISAETSTEGRLVKVKVTTTGEVDHIILPSGTTVYKNNFDYIVKESGTYDFTAFSKDGVSKESTVVTIDEIDTDAPLINFSYSPTDLTKVKVSVSDKNFDYLITPNGEKITNTEYDYDATKLQGTFTAYDKSGNMSTKEFMASSITIGDTSKSVTFVAVDGLPTAWQNTDAKITVSAQNNDEGVKSVTISDGYEDTVVKPVNKSSSLELDNNVAYSRKSREKALTMMVGALKDKDISKDLNNIGSINNINPIKHSKATRKMYIKNFVVDAEEITTPTKTMLSAEPPVSSETSSVAYELKTKTDTSVSEVKTDTVTDKTEDVSVTRDMSVEEVITDSTITTEENTTTTKENIITKKDTTTDDVVSEEITTKDDVVSEEITTRDDTTTEEITTNDTATTGDTLSEEITTNDTVTTDDTVVADEDVVEKVVEEPLVVPEEIVPLEEVAVSLTEVASNNKEVGENGYINYMVETPSGRYKTSVEVNYIDKVEPNIKVNSKEYDKSTGYTTVDVAVTDNASGIQSIALPTGETINLPNSEVLSKHLSFKVMATGDMDIIVSDYAGNQITKTLSFNTDKADISDVVTDIPAEDLGDSDSDTNTGTDTDKPGDDTNKPDDNTNKPGDGTGNDKPDDTDKPVDNTDDSNKPNDSTDKPEDNTNTGTDTDTDKPGDTDLDNGNNTGNNGNTGNDSSSNSSSSSSSSSSKNKNKRKNENSDKETADKKAEIDKVNNKIYNSLPFTLPEGKIDLSKLIDLDLKDFNLLLDVNLGVQDLEFSYNGKDFKSKLKGIKSTGKLKNYNDVKNNYWAKESIDEATKEGFLEGTTKTMYSPKETLKYADTFAAINRVLMKNHKFDVNNKRSDIEKLTNSFNKNHWAYYSFSSILSKLELETAVEYSSYGEEVYNKGMTRGELAKVLYQLTKDSNIPATRQRVIYKDLDNVSTEIDYCTRTRLMIGDKKGNFNSNQLLTRAELASVVNRLNQKLK